MNQSCVTNDILSFLCYLNIQRSMFYWASMFNQDIGNWNVSNGVYFVSKATLNIIITNYEPKCVTNDILSFLCYLNIQSGMFGRASVFNQDIGNWNMSNGVYFVSKAALNISTIINYQPKKFIFNNLLYFSAAFFSCPALHVF